MTDLLKVKREDLFVGERQKDSSERNGGLLRFRLDAQDDRLKPHYESPMRHLGHLQTAQNELRRTT